MATAEFSKFAGILSATLSQHMQISIWVGCSPTGQEGQWKTKETPNLLSLLFGPNTKLAEPLLVRLEVADPPLRDMGQITLHTRRVGWETAGHLGKGRHLLLQNSL